MKLKYICIHGHFYQPPRENPWLEEIETQESAYPFHDWNDRINFECYKPNSQARLLDRHNRVRRVINNYEYISFDFGPTLLSWLEQHATDTYEAILEADAASVKLRSGHGNAIAHAYNHLIMPFATSRDKVTQVLWGIEDFSRRFKRDPEGMWLPETAVDMESLSLLATNGIKFTILAPNQAYRFRGSSRQDFIDSASESIDPSRPYICRLPKGRSIAVFFYDGPISRAIAFERLLESGDNLKNRLLAAFSDKRTWPQLIHIATDGESYGHHHRFGEMALAYAIEQLNSLPEVRITNYGEYLKLHPPKAEVEIIENSSWSCAHGIGRWSEDCGCSISHKPNWNQKWRAPLRKALDLLRDRVDILFEQQAESIFKDPWEARNGYIKVVLENRPKIGPFFKIHGLRQLKKEGRSHGLNLMELQRNRMLVYTSCGWFFDDISGIETLQILRYAARVLQLAYPYDPTIVKDFLGELSEARSNIRPCISGDEIFTKFILPEVADLSRVSAHAAITSVFEHSPIKKRLFCYEIKVHDLTRDDFAGRTLLMARMTILSRITTESLALSLAVFYVGGIDIRCSADDYMDSGKYETMKEDLLRTFRDQSATELTRILDKYFGEKYYTIKDLFSDRRRKILDTLTQKMYESEASLLETFYNKNRDIGKLIADYHATLPDTFLAAARFALDRRLIEESRKLSEGRFPDELEAAIRDMKLWNIPVQLSEIRKLLQNKILALVGDLSKNPRSMEIPADIIRLLDFCDKLEIRIEMGEAQTKFFQIAESFESPENEEYPPDFVRLGQRLAVCLKEQ